jgi:LysM repeat protein
MPDSKGSSGKKILGVPRTYAIIGGIGLSAGLLYAWWSSTHKKKGKSTSTSSTIVITGSTSSQTGINGALLNAILRDWQEHPPSSSKTTTPPKTTKTTTTTGPPGKPPPVHNPPPPVGHGRTSVTYTSYTVKAGQSLKQIADMYHISVAQLAHSNVYVRGEVPGDKKVGQTLGTGAGLKTGQVLRIPHYKTTT